MNTGDVIVFCLCFMNLMYWNFFMIRSCGVCRWSKRFKIDECFAF